MGRISVKFMVLAVLLGLLVITYPGSAGMASGDAQAETAWQVAAVQYHGNIKSHVFHRPSCRYFNCKNCVAVFSSRDEALAAGYRPCKVCNP